MARRTKWLANYAGRLCHLPFDLYLSVIVHALNFRHFGGFSLRFVAKQYILQQKCLNE